MNRLFDPKMYEDHAARHNLESEWSGLIHAEFKDSEGDLLVIGDNRVLECVAARIIASVAYRNREPIGEVTLRVHRLALNAYEERLQGGS